MGSPLSPLMANAFMCSVEEKLARENKLPSFYKRYVDDTLALVLDLSDATDLLVRLNEASSIQFMMEVATIVCHSLAWKSSKSTAALKPAFTERKQIKGSSGTTKAMLTAGTNGHC